MWHRNRKRGLWSNICLLHNKKRNETTNLPSTLLKYCYFNQSNSNNYKTFVNHPGFNIIYIILQTIFSFRGGLRDYEVYRFNNTVISSGETKVFKYFWKIERFTERLQSNVSVLSSPVFVISGLNLRIKATLNHGEKDNMYLQVEQLSPLDDELRKRPNVILQEGSLYDSVETKKFLRHKIVLLNQVWMVRGFVRINDLRELSWGLTFGIFIIGSLQGVPFSDLNSQELWNTNTGFTIPYRALLTNSYLKQDKILVEVVIYLWGLVPRIAI